MAENKWTVVARVEIALGVSSSQVPDLGRLSLDSLLSIEEAIKKLANPVAAQPSQLEPTEKIEMEPEADAPASSQEGCIQAASE